MAKGKRKRPKTPRPPQRIEAAEATPQPAPAPDTAARPGSMTAPLMVVQRVAAILLMAAFGGSLAAYFIPRRSMPGEETPAVQRMQAPRVWETVRFWGLSRDEKRRRSPKERMGGQVFAFTQFWGKYLDERLMPMTKFPDWTRDEHIAYLLPGTGRPAPPGADKRPPVIVGYNLMPTQFEPTVFTPLTVSWDENEPVGRIVLDEGRPVGQSFITHLDFDRIDAVAVLVLADSKLRARGYTGVIYSALNRRHVLARATRVCAGSEEGKQVLEFEFEPPLRLKHHRGSTPYLFEMSWQRPAGYAGPAPTLPLYGATTLVVSDLYIDGERQPDKDLGFMALGTHTDVEGYTRVLPLPRDSDPVEWPSYFFAVRDDVYERAGELSSKPTPAEFAEFADRLNKVLLEL